jgi:hypothetical protein
VVILVILLYSRQTQDTLRRLVSRPKRDEVPA